MTEKQVEEWLVNIGAAVLTGALIIGVLVLFGWALLKVLR